MLTILKFPQMLIFHSIRIPPHSKAAMEFTGRSPIVMLSAAGPPLRAKPQGCFPGRGALKSRTACTNSRSISPRAASGVLA